MGAYKDKYVSTFSVRMYTLLYPHKQPSSNRQSKHKFVTHLNHLSSCANAQHSKQKTIFHSRRFPRLCDTKNGETYKLKSQTHNHYIFLYDYKDKAGTIPTTYHLKAFGKNHLWRIITAYITYMYIAHGTERQIDKINNLFGFGSLVCTLATL